LYDSSLAFKSPISGLAPIAGGIIKFLGDVLTANTKHGNITMSYVAPIPAIPEELTSLKLKKVFFYMEPQRNHQRNAEWLSRVIMGRDDVNFDFLDRFGFKLSSSENHNFQNVESELIINNINNEDFKFHLDDFFSVFKNDESKKAIHAVILNYQAKKNKMDNTHNLHRTYFIKTSKPHQTKHFFMDHPLFKDVFNRILILDDSSFLELSDDSSSEKKFISAISELSTELYELGVQFIDQCMAPFCLDLNVPDVNLISIAKAGDAIKLDAIIQANKIPESFKLKGFIEFEVRIKTLKGI
jgi:hypothetical protein